MKSLSILVTLLLLACTMQQEQTGDETGIGMEQTGGIEQDSIEHRQADANLAQQVEQLLLLGRTDQALQVISESAGSSAHSTEHMQVNLARAYAQKGDIPKAEAVLRVQCEALTEGAQEAQEAEDSPMQASKGSEEGSQVPRGTLARLTLGKLLVTTRRYTEALPLLQAALLTEVNIYMYICIYVCV
jgi:hypothetical protein